MASMSPEVRAMLVAKDIDPEAALLLADSIGQFESRNVPTAVQVGGGPGKGLYQYEAGSAQSAYNRAKTAQRALKIYLDPISY